DHPRDLLAILGVDARGPQVGRLVDVGVGRDDEVLPGIAGARGAGPARVARRVQAPLVRFVDDELARAHAVFLQCTSVKGGAASSWGSNTAATGAPIGMSPSGASSRLPIMR